MTKTVSLAINFQLIKPFPELGRVQLLTLQLIWLVRDWFAAILAISACSTNFAKSKKLWGSEGGRQLQKRNHRPQQGLHQVSATRSHQSPATPSDQSSTTLYILMHWHWHWHIVKKVLPKPSQLQIVRNTQKPSFAGIFLKRGGSDELVWSQIEVEKQPKDTRVTAPTRYSEPAVLETPALLKWSLLGLIILATRWSGSSAYLRRPVWNNIHLEGVRSSRQETETAGLCLRM